MNATLVYHFVNLALAVLLLTAPAAQADDTYEREIKVEPGQKIELEMDSGGSVKAEGWDRDLVQIVCTESANGLENYDLELEETRGGLRFVGEPKRGYRDNTNLSVRLMVPREFDIEVESAGGSIRITGVTGEFSGKTGGGQIVLLDVKGHADLTTGGGKIRIEDSELNGRVTSGGGGALVKNVVGNVKASSGGGVVSYQNVRDRDGDLRSPGGVGSDRHGYGNRANDETILYSSAGGSIDLDEAPEGAIVSTGGGNIEIRNAERFVRAQTGGGSIEIEIRDGVVAANTGAGDIEVEISGGFGDGDGDVDLSTGYGDIVLILPDGISAELDLDLSYTRNSSRDYEIFSDFDIDQERTSKWDSSHGSPRKHIYGTGTVGRGGVKVKINCVNGNIRVKSR